MATVSGEPMWLRAISKALKDSGPELRTKFCTSLSGAELDIFNEVLVKLDTREYRDAAKLTDELWTLERLLKVSLCQTPRPTPIPGVR